MAGPGDDDNKTRRGFHTPGVGGPKDTVMDPPRMEPAPPVGEAAFAESGELYLPAGTTMKADPHAQKPLVEIEVMHQHGPAPRMDRPSQVLEVWTQNRVYSMDASMHCVMVMDRATGEFSPNHGFIGHRLVGGQHRDGETFELSYPFPRPGTEAVFEHNDKHSRFSRTSTVHRVVLRLHVVTVAPNKLVPTWADITHHEAATLPQKPGG